MIPKIEIHPVFSKIEATWDDLKKAREVVTVSVPNAQYTAAYKEKRWDGKKCLLTLEKNTKKFGTCGYFPTGLLHFITHAVPNATIEVPKIPIEIAHKRIKPEKMEFEPYNHQWESLERLCAEKRGTVFLAPNAGKTEILAMFANLFLQQTKDEVLLYLCYGTSLAQQTFERMYKYFSNDVGLILQKKIEIKRFTIASVTTLNNHRRDLFEFLTTNVKAVFFDECHLASAQTWTIISQLCNSAHYRFGLSGTPFTGNLVRDLVMIGHTGKPIVEITNKQLVDLGVSAKPNIYMVRYKHIDQYSMYETAVDSGIVNNVQRNLVIATLVQYELEKNPNHRFLIVVNRVEHGNNILQILETRVKVSFVQGNLKQKDRGVELQSQIVIGTSVVDFGLDLDIDVLILASGGRGKGGDKEPVRQLQRLGRGLRRKRGKEEVTVYDFYDVGNKWLEKHSRERLRAWKDENFPPTFLDA